jgi:D-arabinose 1-dehydrogenase-like Zn-dependent alcohol dehydrogenase
MLPKTMKAAVLHQFGGKLTIEEMPKAVAFAIEGNVKATVHAAKIENINSVFDEMKKGEIDGRIVLDIAIPAPLHNLLAKEKTGKTPTALTLS